jgi:hypothetical protein
MSWEDGETGYKGDKVPWGWIVLILIIAAFGYGISYCVRPDHANHWQDTGKPRI